MKALIVELRDRTGAGIMACKKALEAADGDIEKAFDALRAKLGKSAEGKASRSATDGKVGIHHDDHRIALVEVRCETDFVSRGEVFQGFADAVAKIAFENKVTDAQALLALPMGEATVEDARVELVGRVGENIQISGVHYAEHESAFVKLYSHNDKVSCAVFVDVDNEEVGKDVAMHIVAMQPLAVVPDQIPADIVAREKAIFEEQTKGMGKPELAEKIVAGKLAKYYKEVCLLDQDFVKDTSMTINEYLTKAKARVLSFIRVELS